MAKPLWCPILSRPGGDRIGDGHWPGSRAYGHLAPNVIDELPVLAGQLICLGYIVTMRNGGIACVDSAAETGDGVNWGDVSGGALMALAPVDTTQPRRRGSPSP